MNEHSSIWLANLQCLESRQPELAEQLKEAETTSLVAVQARRSGFTIRDGNHYCISAYDPEKEALEQYHRLQKTGNNSSPILLLGFELGYLARIIIEREKSDLLIVEPSLEMLKLAMQTNDLTSIIKRSRFIIQTDYNFAIRKVHDYTGSSNQNPVIFESIAAKRMFPEYLASFKLSIQQTERSKNQRYRILVVGPIYGGSLPVARHTVDAFRQLGHKTEFLDNSAFADGLDHLDKLGGNQLHQDKIKSGFISLLSQTVLVKALDMKAQLIFFIAQAPVTAGLLQELKKIGIPTAYWFVEDGRLMEYGLKIAPWFDVFFHIQKGWYERELHRAGAKVIHYLPMAANPLTHKPISLDAEQVEFYSSDISHMGAGYFNRRNFFLGLLDFHFKLWGNDWNDPGILARNLQKNGERISTEETNMIFNATKININLHSSIYVEGVDPHGDFINPRTFEIACSGGFQLVDERSLLPELFIPDEEIVTFRDLASCRDQIRYYLDHSDERRKIAEAGRKRVLREHTFKHRMREAIEVIFNHCSPAFSETPLNTVKALMEEAGEDRELADFYRNLGEPDEIVTLESIAEKVGESEEELTETGALFVLMNEFYNWSVEKGLV